MFDAIQELESEDARTETQRRKKSSKQAHRSLAAQSQTKVYHHLVECRILLQRAVTTKVSEEESETFEENCNDILENLLQARRQLLAGEAINEDDETNEYTDMVRKYSSGELQETLQQEYETCREEWKEVLDRRHKDLKLHSGLTAKSQFRVLDSSFWQQVDATIEYEQLRRHGKDNEEEDQLDDSKVYQQLLKDFVAHTATTSSGAANRLKTAKSPQNTKKQVDRRASKGRKIRYKEIPKLVNFTFPLSRPNASGLDQDEWFQSLFGGAGKMM